MKLNKLKLLSVRWMRSAVFTLVLTAVPLTRASTIWNGPTTNFAPTAPYTGTDPANEDVLTADVALARGPDFPLYNPLKESAYNGPAGSPSNTLWALGSLSNYASLTYGTWGTVIGGAGDQKQLYLFLPGETYVVHLVPDDIYLSITFTKWDSGTFNGDVLFAYTRTTPALAAPKPTVNITNPVGGAVFSAPANVTLAANASVGNGTVTNVTFYNGSIVLGTATASPFGITASNLAANSYGLTAVATAAGVSATSPVVNITVVTPVAVFNSAPAITGGQFSFGYTANAGLTYIVKRSPDLVNWAPIATNVASGSPVLFQDAPGLSTLNFYEVVRQANP